MRWIADRMTVRRAGYFSAALLGGALGIVRFWQAAWGAALPSGSTTLRMGGSPTHYHAAISSL